MSKKQEQNGIFDYEDFVSGKKKKPAPKKQAAQKPAAEMKPTAKTTAAKSPTEKRKSSEKKRTGAHTAPKKTLAKRLEEKFPEPERKEKPPKKDKPAPARTVPAEKHEKPHTHESIETIKKMFGEALSEDIEEIEEIAAEELPPELPAADPEGLRKRLFFALGAAMIILSVIGLISTVNAAVAGIRAFTDNTKQKEEFARFIYPVVICDPAPFNQSVKLRGETMLSAAIWNIILYEDKGKYQDEFDYIIVPEVEVERHAIELFGPGLGFNHESILGPEVQFYYEEDIKSYRIPSNPTYYYYPHVEDISRVGERYTLVVAYMPPAPAWARFTGEESIPDKYVEYVVSKRGADYTLLEVKESFMLYGGEHGE